MLDTEGFCIGVIQGIAWPENPVAPPHSAYATTRSARASASARSWVMDVIGKKMTIVGAGGAATAIEIQAALDGVAEITIFNRKDEFWDRAVSTVEKINTKTSCHAVLYDLADLDKLKAEMDDSFIFVNATGVGMKPLEGQSVVPDKSYFRPELIVIDVPYSPLETKMRSMAKEVGCKTMNGLGMMLFQGSAAFELWTGEPMPIEHMKEILHISYDD